MLPCAGKVRISIGLADECVIPSGVLRGEVIVVVHPSCTDGIRYRRIRLELTGREHNAVRDDQGEFDALLNGYTSDRTYLSRHVTLSGRKKASEDLETALQRKQKVMFRQHHTAPYHRVIPVKPQEPKDDRRRKSAAPAHPPPPEAPAPATSGSLHHAGDVEMRSRPAERSKAKAGGGREEDEELDNVEVDRRTNSPSSSGSDDEGEEAHSRGGAEGNASSRGGGGIVLPDTVLPKSDGKNESSGNTASSGGDSGMRGKTASTAASAPAPPPRLVQPPTVAAIQQLEAREERSVDDARAAKRKAKDARLMPGRYTFPFSFRVPPWLPPSLYYSIADASGWISYSAKATIDFGSETRHLTSSKRFYVLSAISRRQLVACHEEAINAATTNPLPPLSALFQVFACSCLGNMCCLASRSAVEVEVALQCSRALVLADVNATYQVFRDYQQKREDVPDKLLEVDARRSSTDSTSVGGKLAGAFSGYDAFMERKPIAPEEDFTSPAAFVDKFLKTHQRQSEKDDGLTHTCSDSNTTRGDSGYGAAANAPDPRSHSARLAAYREAKRDTMRARRAEVERALPLPIGVLPLLVRVHNGCSTREIDKVRVELRETIQVFKSLEMPRVFKHPLARYDYTVSIPPGDEVTFAARLQLPKQFRRRREDDARLCPPPGIKTANIVTSTEIAVCFPGLATYVEEEDWVNSIVQLAEAVDMSDEVLDLPVRYS